MKCNFTEKGYENPILGLALLRLAVVALFFLPGIMKLMNPDMIVNMVQTKVGLPGNIGVFFAWVTIVTEIIGAIFVFLGPIIPRVLYKLALLGFFIILIISLGTIQIPSGDMMNILSHSLMLASVVCLLLTDPSCPADMCPKK